MKSNVAGLLNEPKLRASGEPYPGRFSCHRVQWAASGDHDLATFTITAQEVADAAEGRILWTDQDVQRGIKPGLPFPVAREIPLADGYPDPKAYIFDRRKADEITEKLLDGQQLFLSPLVWNLRPGSFEAYWNAETGDLYLYSGKVYLPDSHHRQQAILKAVRLHQESPKSYPGFSPDQQFILELYFLNKEDEGNYFFAKNQQPKRTAKSKAYDLSTTDDLSLLAKKVIDRSDALTHNVNRVTDRLNAGNPQVVTLSTLRQMMAFFAPDEVLDETEIDGLAEVAGTFYDMLAEARPELGLLEVKDRKKVRKESLVDSGVMMFGYARLMSDFHSDIGEKGMRAGVKMWSERLRRLADGPYRFGNWEGDFFSRQNPLWRELGILKPSPRTNRLTVTNTGATRATCGRVLRQFLTVKEVPTDLQFLVAQ